MSQCDEQPSCDDASTALLQRSGWRPWRRRVARGARVVILLVLWAPLGVLLWRDRPYELDLASQFAKHIAAVWGLWFVVLLPLRRWKWALQVGLAALALGTVVLRADRPPNTSRMADLAGTRVLRVVHYNAHGEISRHDQVFLDWLEAEDPDLVCIVDAPWNFTVTNGWLAERYPYRAEPAPGVEWGNLLLSKEPARIIQLAQPSEQTKWSFITRRSLRVTPSGAAPFIFTALHPASPRTRKTWSMSLSQVRRDGTILRRWRQSNPEPIIVASDTNSTPTGRVYRTFARVSGLLGWSPHLSGGTWPAQLAPQVALPIDRIWTSPDVRVGTIRVGPRFASDHRPIVVELGIPGSPAGAR